MKIDFDKIDENINESIKLAQASASGSHPLFGTADSHLRHADHLIEQRRLLQEQNKPSVAVLRG